MNLSLNQTLLTFLLCEKNLDDSIDCDNFSIRGYPPLIQKDSSTHIHGLIVYVKEGLPFAWELSLENSADSYLCFQLVLLSFSFTLLSFTSFSFINHLCCLCALFFILFHLTEMRFSRSTHLRMFLSLETLMSIIRTDLPFLVELIHLVNCVIIFLSQMTLPR